MNASYWSLKPKMKELGDLPVGFYTPSPDGHGGGWHMKLGQLAGVGLPSAFPGVYSTSFGVQLLCERDQPEEPASRAAIIGGLTYLFWQFNDSQRIDAGEVLDCKQSQKLTEVGHHDFKLTLKLAEVLEAVHAVWKVRTKHKDFAELLAKDAAIIDKVEAALAGIAVESQEQGEVFRAWPWHSGKDGQEDAIPTCHAVLALTHPNTRATPMTAEVENYLTAELHADRIPFVHKVQIMSTLLLLYEREERPTAKLLAEGNFVNKLREHIRDPHELAWQESMYYSLPSAKRGISHYKPWIWTFPRMEAAECLLRCGSTAAADVTPVLAALVQNPNRERGSKGAVQFHLSQAPTLLASLRAAELLRLAENRLLAQAAARAQFFRSTVWLKLRAFARQHPGAVYGVFALWIFVTILGYREQLSVVATDVEPSLSLVSRAWKILAPYWPLWLAAWIIMIMLHAGKVQESGWRLAIRAFIEMLLVIFLAFLLELLGARQ